MEVTDYELFEVPPRWQLLKIETSDGLVGWGEPYTKWHNIDDTEPTTRGAVDEMMKKYVLGEDPTQIEDLWQAMYRSSFYRGGPIHMSAIAGIDEALWDVKGKQVGKPVHELLGGRVRDGIRIYHHVTDAESAKRAVNEGFTALKFTPFDEMNRVESPAKLAEGVETVRSIREAVGNEVDLGLDFHGRASKSLAKQIAPRLEQFTPMFIEEPVLAENNDALAGLSRHTNIPIATGERMYTRWDFKDVLVEDSVDVVQPDVSHAGGITETLKIASMAEAFDVAVAPHCPMGPVSVAATLQADACMPNFLIQEQAVLKDDTWRDYVENTEFLAYDDEGYVEIPDRPGLGVDVDEASVREAHENSDLQWKRDVWRHDDGGIAER